VATGTGPVLAYYPFWNRERRPYGTVSQPQTRNHNLDCEAILSESRYIFTNLHIINAHYFDKCIKCNPLQWHCSSVDLTGMLRNKTG